MFCSWETAIMWDICSDWISKGSSYLTEFISWEIWELYRQSRREPGDLKKNWPIVMSCCASSRLRLVVDSLFFPSWWISKKRWECNTLFGQWEGNESMSHMLQHMVLYEAKRVIRGWYAAGELVTYTTTATSSIFVLFRMFSFLLQV
jgi:hypothetical protein